VAKKTSPPGTTRVNSDLITTEFNRLNSFHKRSGQWNHVLATDITAKRDGWDWWGALQSACRGGVV
jgi:hypothetical protein